MRKSRRQPVRGFTLIELLIVIAIIAILALIAIPNFPEAQTRSKVSRALADMRSVATALEAYQIDYNAYIWSAHNHSHTGGGKDGAYATPYDFYLWYRNLSTPVAFITSLPRDPFSVDNYGVSGKQFYCYYAGTQYGQYDCTGPRAMWAMVCMGPDRVTQVNNIRRSQSTVQNYWGNIDYLIDITHGDPSNTLPYDPSNGTISTGDIVRLSSGFPTTLNEISPGASAVGFFRFQ